MKETHFGGGNPQGAPDGVGGALKNLADRIVSCGTNIPNAEILYDQLRVSSSVKLFKISEEDTEKISELVPLTLKAVAGTMPIHQLFIGLPQKDDLDKFVEKREENVDKTVISIQDNVAVVHQKHRLCYEKKALKKDRNITYSVRLNIRK
ncbi:hypothetical protein WMY93_002387 [Mugilogobius chulae]|uniref:Uncharacterized protein n=1 Tax=Mugilogobius chulae TaxID=88201 RepID=A0AAW0PZI0_9GOBI